MRRGHGRTGLVLIAVALAASSCSDSGVKGEPGVTPKATTTGPSASKPSATLAPEVQAAADAYEAFNDAANNAQRKPVADGEKLTAAADFTKHSFDPLKTEYSAYIWSLESQGVEFRGTPYESHISVTKVDLKASPWPVVTLTDCPSGDDWDEYSIKTNKRVPSADDGDVPPPWLVTAKVIYYKGHWGVQSTTVDKDRTCTA
jgi:hypothetical protein